MTYLRTLSPSLVWCNHNIGCDEKSPVFRWWNHIVRLVPDLKNCNYFSEVLYFTLFESLLWPPDMVYFGLLIWQGMLIVQLGGIRPNVCHSFSAGFTAQWSYPHEKVSIRYLSQISTTAPILKQSHYFRQNIRRLPAAQFHFWIIFGFELIKVYCGKNNSTN